LDYGNLGTLNGPDVGRYYHDKRLLFTHLPATRPSKLGPVKILAYRDDPGATQEVVTTLRPRKGEIGGGFDMG